MTVPALKNTGIQRQPRRANGLADEPRCPYCGGPATEATLARIASEERARLAKAEETLRGQFSRELAEAEKKSKAAIELARRDAAKTADAVVKQRLEAQRAALEKVMAQAVSAEKARSYEERMKLDAQLHELQRKLQNKPASELGEQSEVEIFELLKKEFPSDRITRFRKGTKGGDVLHEVVTNGIPVGKIIYEIKNTTRWMNKYVDKLRADQVAEQADHAMLVTSVFPAPAARQLHLQDGVLVIHPRLVTPVVHLLRRQLAQAHTLRVGSEDRHVKAEALYRFITSESAAQLWEDFAKITEGLNELDQVEMDRHRRVWAKRADLVTGLIGLHDRFSETVNKIIGITGSGASSATDAE